MAGNWDTITSIQDGLCGSAVGGYRCWSVKLVMLRLDVFMCIEEHIVRVHSAHSRVIIERTGEQTEDNRVVGFSV